MTRTDGSGRLDLSTVGPPAGSAECVPGSIRATARTGERSLGGRDAGAVDADRGLPPLRGEDPRELRPEKKDLRRVIDPYQDDYQRSRRPVGRGDAAFREVQADQVFAGDK